MLILASIDLYAAGLSTRQIQNHLSTVYGIETSHMAIYRWLRKYSRLIARYIETLKPKVGSQWHTDEMVLSTEGKSGYLWNTLDKKTKFLLASLLTSGRSEQDAFKAISTAIRQAKRRPDLMITDGLGSYRKGVARNRIKRHISSARFVDARNNNPVENLHSQLRPRYRMTRGLGSPSVGSDLVNLFMIGYNFARPKRSLMGRTPAEAAGLRLGGRNPWLALSRSASGLRPRKRR